MGMIVHIFIALPLGCVSWAFIRRFAGLIFRKHPFDSDETKTMIETWRYIMMISYSVTCLYVAVKFPMNRPLSWGTALSGLIGIFIGNLEYFFYMNAHVRTLLLGLTAAGLGFIAYQYG